MSTVEGTTMRTWWQNIVYGAIWMMFALLGVAGLFASGDTGEKVVAMVLLAGGLPLSCKALAARLVIHEHGLVVHRYLRRKRTLQWGDVVGFRVGETNSIFPWLVLKADLRTGTSVTIIEIVSPSWQPRFVTAVRDRLSTAQSSSRGR